MLDDHLEMVLENTFAKRNPENLLILQNPGSDNMKEHKRMTENEETLISKIFAFDRSRIMI